MGVREGTSEVRVGIDGRSKAKTLSRGRGGADGY
jgi:hypothetical protein